MAAFLLRKLVGQPMHGPKVAITLARFLPDGLVSIIRDGPGETVVVALEQTTVASILYQAQLIYLHKFQQWHQSYTRRR